MSESGCRLGSLTWDALVKLYIETGEIEKADSILNKASQQLNMKPLQYDSLLQAYINAKVPIYGFRERLKADNMFPSKMLAERLAQVDAFKKTAVSDLLD
ncbi:hypothetical protein E3N88_42244 [Mikania micrantha]|uniref:Pentacotripeptide-repeat region of PRORP domain-containing protein n=1 Tax=Mikania micrantha TaxID=192012 RepID=A0A5N6LIB0_9ASTR|nr:hypothetical protein E3N88_42244 [Mikania micrantha]